MRHEYAAHLAALVEEMNDVELAVVVAIADRIARIGRPHYGPMLLDDGRDDIAESLEEFLDAAVYLARAITRLRRGGRRTPTTG